MAHRIPDLALMAFALDQLLRDDVERWAAELDDRKQWLNADSLPRHIFSGTMLVGLFAYAEGRLNRFWWRRLRSTRAVKGFDMLWLARNAFVHNNSEMRTSRFLTYSQLSEFTQYCQDLQNGTLKDDHGVSFPTYMTLNGCEFRFNKSANHIFKSMFTVAFRAENLGRL